jgi:hypothetical protein
MINRFNSTKTLNQRAMVKQHFKSGVVIPTISICEHARVLQRPGGLSHSQGISTLTTFFQEQWTLCLGNLALILKSDANTHFVKLQNSLLSFFIPY